MKRTKQIVEDAKTLSEMSEDYNLLDMLLYLEIRQILNMYFRHQISREEANKLKEKVINQYEKNKEQFEFQQSICEEYIKDIEKTEELRKKLRNQLTSDTELNEILNTCIEIIQIYSKEEFI